MNFNVAPYNDDFSEDKNHHKVLFKPGYPIQARELNTLQSILQNQVAAVGNHLFKNGAKISGCSTTFVQYSYVRLADQYNNVDVKLSTYNNKSIKLVGKVSGVEAKIIDVTEKTSTDAPTLYVIYTKTGIDGQQSTFIPGEDIHFYDAHNVLVYTVTARCPSCAGNTTTDTVNPIGSAMFFNIEEGIFYYNGLFVKTPQQHYITEKYLVKDSSGNISSSLTYRIGLDVIESISTVDDDNTLYDPHLGYPNFAAPGADRYKVELKLAVKDYVEDGDSTSFILLAKVRQNQNIEYKKDDTDYNLIMDELARRTYETSGNFAVQQWKTKFLNEKKSSDSDTLGWTTSGNDSNYVAIVSPGVGYVKGYRVANLSDSVVVGTKARDTKKLRGAVTAFTERSYIDVTVTGNVSWINHTGISTLTNQSFNLVDSTSTSIGSFKAYDIYRMPGTSYRIYMYGLTMTSGKTFSNAVTVKLTDGSFTGTIISTAIQNSNNNSLLFPLGYSSIKTIRDNDDNTNGNTSLQIRKRLSGILDGTGSITFTSSTNESFITPANAYVVCWTGSNPNGTTVVLDSSKYTYTPTSLTISLGSSFAGNNISYVTSLTRTSQQENTKTLTSHVYTTSAAPSGLVSSVISLPHCDGYKLTSVKMISISDNTVNVDITSEYTFDDGQTDNFYTPATLTRNTARTFVNDNRLIITYYYFEHSGNAGFFTVDSYSQLINDKSLNLTYSDIPSYKDNNGTTYQLAECIDFRTLKGVTGTVDTTAIMPLMNSTVIYDVEYYLPRADLLQVNSDGAFYIKEGVSSESPSLPVADDNAMPLYEIHLGAYTYTLNDIQTNYIDNKRFSMKDISKLESRISNIEYYVALNMLESQTVNMSIKDSNGLDRYKNGYLVDNYTTYYGVDITNYEFKACLDRTSGELRPQYKQNNVRLKFDAKNSANIVQYGNVAMSQFEHDLFIQNPFATQSLSINPYMVFRRTGNMSLSPNIDTWSDDTTLPTVTTTIDSGTEALQAVADAAGLLSTDYSSWVDMNSTIIGTSTTTNSSTGSGQIVTSATTYTTTETTSQRTATTTGISSKTQSYTIDDIVKDVAITPYIRENTVQFYATNLKPNTQMYAYFDGINVTQHCKATTQVSTTADVVTARNATIYGGAAMISDSNGNLTGEFRIPGGTFFTGEKKFVLTNDPNNTGNADIETTRAEATYFAGGVSTTKQSSTLNIVTPVYGTTTSVESQTTTSVSRSTTVTTASVSSPSVVRTTASGPNIPPMPDYTPAGNWSSHYHWIWNGSSWVWDPVAQGFSVDTSCFISKIGVYFEAVDTSSDVIWFEIREMVNGYPSSEYITHKEVKAADLASYVSTDASIEYQVEFSCPVYVDSSKSYAFVVGGFSPDSRIFISHLGDKLLGSDSILEQPPLNYTMFRSLNGETWNAEQYDTMKLNIYRCVFNMSATTFNFYNENEDAFYLGCDKNPIQVQNGSNQVRIHAKNHNLRANDRVILDFNKDMYYTIEATDGIPQIGQAISTATMSGYVKDIKVTDTLNYYKISIDDMIGYFVKNQEFACESRQYEYRDLFLISETGASGVAITQNEASGYVRVVKIDGIPDDISGAPISLFAKEHIVKAVDSMDSFIVEVDGTFATDGTFGGDNVRLIGNNVKYDMFNIAGNYLTYDTINSCVVNTYNNDSTVGKSITTTPLVDTYVDSPRIIISSRNESRLLGTNHSYGVTFTVNTRSPYISAVFNTDSFSVTTVSNRIEMIDINTYNQAPGSNRYVSETNGFLGSETYKAITTKVLLNNAASDMKLLFDVYCSKESDFDIYVKYITAQNNIDDSLLPWIKVDNYIKQPASTGLNDFTEYDLQLSKNCTKWSNSIEYISFRVKLVGRSSNSSQPVLFKNFRAIAIT